MASEVIQYPLRVKDKKTWELMKKLAKKNGRSLRSEIEMALYIYAENKKHII